MCFGLQVRHLHDRGMPARRRLSSEQGCGFSRKGSCQLSDIDLEPHANPDPRNLDCLEAPHHFSAQLYGPQSSADANTWPRGSCNAPVAKQEEHIVEVSSPEKGPRALRQPPGVRLQAPVRPSKAASQDVLPKEAGMQPLHPSAMLQQPGAAFQDTVKELQRPADAAAEALLATVQARHPPRRQIRLSAVGHACVTEPNKEPPASSAERMASKLDGSQVHMLRTENAPVARDAPGLQQSQAHAALSPFLQAVLAGRGPVTALPQTRTKVLLPGTEEAQAALTQTTPAEHLQGVYTAHKAPTSSQSADPYRSLHADGNRQRPFEAPGTATKAGDKHAQPAEMPSEGPEASTGGMQMKVPGLSATARELLCTAQRGTCLLGQAQASMEPPMQLTPTVAPGQRISLGQQGAAFSGCIMRSQSAALLTAHAPRQKHEQTDHNAVTPNSRERPLSAGRRPVQIGLADLAGSSAMVPSPLQLPHMACSPVAAAMQSPGDILPPPAWGHTF